MALLYVRVYHRPTGANPRIAAIAYRWMEDGGQLAILGVGGESERDILRSFEAATSFWAVKWGAVACGVGLDSQLGHLWGRSLAQGLVEFGASPWGRKPTVDLGVVLAMMNSDAPPSSEPTDKPPMLERATLDRYVGRRLLGSSVADLLRNGQVAAAERAIREEADAFASLWNAVASEAPKWRMALAP